MSINIIINAHLNILNMHNIFYIQMHACIWFFVNLHVFCSCDYPTLLSFFITYVTARQSLCLTLYFVAIISLYATLLIKPGTWKREYMCVCLAGCLSLSLSACVNVCRFNVWESACTCIYVYVNVRGQYQVSFLNTTHRVCDRVSY